MRQHVFIATPCYGGMVTQGYMQSVIALMAAAGTRDIDLTLAMLGQDALITRCRNTLVGQFLSRTEATHLLFVDADISFQPENLFRLLNVNKPIAAGVYPLKAYYWDTAFRRRYAAGEHIETAGLHYVGSATQPPIVDGDFAMAEFAGTGFMLIERATIDRMVAAYPETRYKAIDAYRNGSGDTTVDHALFDCVIEPDTGVYRSEDFTFCWRWRQIGGEIWLDTRGTLTHTGLSDYHGAPAIRFSCP